MMLWYLEDVNEKVDFLVEHLDENERKFIFLQLAISKASISVINSAVSNDRIKKSRAVFQQFINSIWLLETEYEKAKNNG